MNPRHLKTVAFILFGLISFLLLTQAAHAYEFVTDSFCSNLAQMEKDARFSKAVSSSQADFIVVDKGRRLLHLLKNEEIIRSFHVALGKNPKGKKQKEGDNKTPEGIYSISWKNAASDFHLALQISYPNAQDREWARKNGVSPGGDIMIHGLPNDPIKKFFISHPKQNWTRGCVAVNDEEIEEIWDYVAKNTLIELCP